VINWVCIYAKYFELCPLKTLDVLWVCGCVGVCVFYSQPTSFHTLLVSRNERNLNPDVMY
jgi:hypothetical protein